MVAQWATGIGVGLNTLQCTDAQCMGTLPVLRCDAARKVPASQPGPCRTWTMHCIISMHPTVGASQP